MSTNQKLVIDNQEYDAMREGTYNPRIAPEYLRKLWLIKQKTGKPITQLVSEALDLYFEILERG
jgi:hypothetical protein